MPGNVASRGLDEPAPAEVARIEAEKARIKAAKIAQLVHGPNGNGTGNGAARPPGGLLGGKTISAADILPADPARATAKVEPPPRPNPKPEAKPESTGLASAGNCPRCGRPFGKIRRCFTCNPTRGPGVVSKPKRLAQDPVVAAVESVSTPAMPQAGGMTPEALLREVELIGAILIHLKGKDRDTAVGALRWVLGRLEGGANHAG